MKILALSCSPSRKRNSDTMLDHFLSGAEKVAGIEIEKIYLEDIPIEMYHHANSKGPGENESELTELARKITDEATGLVIASPTYNFSVPGHLKNFIDRMRFFALDLTRRNKFDQPVGKLGHLKTYFLVSGGTPNWAEKILFFSFPAFWLRGLFLYFGAKVMGAIYSGDIQTFKNTEVLKKCHDKGMRYGQNLIRGHSHGILENIFWRPPQVR